MPDRPPSRSTDAGRRAGDRKGSGLNRKLGPLPVWGWGIGLLGAILLGLYLRHRLANAGQSGAQPAAGTDTAGSGSGGGGATPLGDTSAGSASPVDLSGIESRLDDLTALLGANQFPPDQFNPSEFGPTDAPAVDAGTKPTAPAFPFLTWGGKVFTNQAAFLSWLGGHGGNLADFSQRHPAGFQILESLPRGTAPVPRARPNTSGGRTGNAPPHPQPNRPNATPNVIDHPSVRPHVPVPGQPRRGGGGRTFAA